MNVLAKELPAASLDNEPPLTPVEVDDDEDDEKASIAPTSSLLDESHHLLLRRLAPLRDAQRALERVRVRARDRLARRVHARLRSRLRLRALRALARVARTAELLARGVVRRRERLEAPRAGVRVRPRLRAPEALPGEAGLLPQARLAQAPAALLLVGAEGVVEELVRVAEEERCAESVGLALGLDERDGVGGQRLSWLSGG